MFQRSILRQVSKASTTTLRSPASAATRHSAARPFSSTIAIRKDDKSDNEDRHDQYTTSGEPGASKDEGQFSRTDQSIRVEYPEDEGLPRQPPVQGRGGVHSKRTLASFSLEDRVAVVTGGARGLGIGDEPSIGYQRRRCCDCRLKSFVYSDDLVLFILS